MRRWLAKFLACGLALAASSAARAEPAPPGAAGRWLTEDRSGIIEIYRCADDELCGRLVWFKPSPEDVGKPPLDGHNPTPALRGRPLCGLELIGGMKPGGDHEWIDGWVYNPESGKTYSAQMSLESDTRLRLRGYVGIPLFGETQLWTRADPALASCAP